MAEREIGIFLAEHAASATHLAHLEGCTALRIVLVAAPCVEGFGWFRVQGSGFRVGFRGESLGFRV